VSETIDFHIDYHIHTYLCGHADEEMTVRNIVQRADQLNLTRLAITEHVGSTREFERIRFIREELEKMTAGPEVIVGAEIDADPEKEDGSFKDSLETIIRDNEEEIGFILGATHQFPGSRYIWHKKLSLSSGEKKTLYEKWFCWAEKIVQNPLVDVFAHPGVLISRNGIVERFNDPGILRDFRGLIRLMKLHRVAFEFNEYVLTKLHPRQIETYPFLFRLALEEGVKISLGSDAHCLSQIGRFPWIRQCFLKIGGNLKDLPLFLPEGERKCMVK